MTSLRSVIQFCMFITLIQHSGIQSISMMNRSDPYPVYTSNDPTDFLTTSVRNHLKSGYEEIRDRDHFTLSLSPFRQSADHAQTDKCVPDSTIVSNGQVCNQVLIGNIYGPWNMLALFYPENNGNTAVQEYLLTALGIETPNTCTDSEITCTCLDAIITPSLSDPDKKFGFLDVPVKYRKVGLRLEAEFLLGCDVGLQLQTGVANIRQGAVFKDLTCTATGVACPVTDSQGTASYCEIAYWDCACKQIVMHDITSQVKKIAAMLNQNACNFEETTAEDTRLRLFWRHAFPVNYSVSRAKQDWPRYVIMPYITIDGIFPTSKTVCANYLFAVPDGNNGHFGGGVTAGFTIDFEETIAIGFEAGGTLFSKKTYCNFPLPTSWLQTGIYPHTGNVTVCPGSNWNVGVLLNAYHFLDRLSFYAQYMMVNHSADCFTINSINPVNGQTSAKSTILTNKLSQNSKFFASMVNVGLSYDISPNMALGFFWQAPCQRRQAYRSTTVMGSFILTY